LPIRITPPSHIASPGGPVREVGRPPS
jgi:hypothetical protein